MKTYMVTVLAIAPSPFPAHPVKAFYALPAADEAEAAISAIHQWMHDTRTDDETFLSLTVTEDEGGQGWEDEP